MDNSSEKPDFFDKIGENNKAIYENIVNCLPVGIVAFDLELKVIDTNAKGKEYLQISKDLYINQILSERTDKAVWQDWSQILANAIAQDETTKLENIHFNLNGEKKLYHFSCDSLKSANGKITGGVIAIEDITEKIQIERQIENIERFAAVGKLAGKVAHELNNPMDGILRYINLTCRILEKENLEKPIEYLTQCRKGLMRMVQIIGELLEFSRSTYNSYEQMYIRDIVEDSIRSMEHKIIGQNITIVKKLANNLPRISGGNLYQVFCNLIKNSVDAMDKGGTLTIATNLDSDNNAIIEFSDTGSGVDETHLKQIFDPFFTTKKQGKGTGLGLAICKDIIEKYQGNIVAENIEGGGTKFKVILPLSSNTETETEI